MCRGFESLLRYQNPDKVLKLKQKIRGFFNRSAWCSKPVGQAWLRNWRYICTVAMVSFITGLQFLMTLSAFGGNLKFVNPSRHMIEKKLSFFLAN